MSQEPLFAIDSGTTNTRAWVLRGEEVLGRGRAAAGVRDTARTGSDEFLKDGVRRALAAALEESSLSEAPRAAVAAGMITSELGLAEVPHLEAPVGWENLSEAVERVEFPDLGGLAVHFVRGVRSGPESPSAETATTADIIRGEETEIFGALEMLSLSGPLV